MQKRDLEEHYLFLEHVVEELAERFRDYPGVHALNEQMQYSLVDEVKAYISFNESDIAFNMLVVQLYEFDVALSKEDVKHIRQVADLLKISYKHWGFVRRLIRN